jgi:GntR family transcriptional regulator
MTAATLAIVIAVAASLFAKETLGWLRRLSEILVRKAIRELPDDIPPAERARWEAEVLADLESFADRPIGCLLHALQVSRRGLQQLGGVLTSDDDPLAGLESQEDPADTELTRNPTPPRLEHFSGATHHTIDRDSEVPLYFQLAAALKVMLEAEPWEPGVRFASEREIEEEFKVSRAVIRPALDLLVGDGAIFRVKGSGAFVAPPRSEVRVAGLAKLWLDVGSRQATILSVRKRCADRLVARNLELEDELAPVAHVVAVMDAGRSTVALVDSYSSVARAPWLISIAKALKNGDDKPPKPGKLKLTRATVSVEHTFFGEWGASQVGAAAGDPALMVHFVQFGRPRGARRERPLEYARVIYRADATELTFDT